MTEGRSVEIALPSEGREAPPRSNGELIFEAPWQSRVFGLAVSLVEQGVFSWTEFQSALVAAIARWESQGAGRQVWSYYGCWQEALERTVAGRGLIDDSEIKQRCALLANRRHGHDHDGAAPEFP